MLFKDSYVLKISFSHYDLNDTGIGGAKKRLKNRAAFKEHSFYISLPVVIQLLHGITAVNEEGDSYNSATLCFHH